MDRKLWGQCLSEFVGTFILIFIGCGSVAQMVLNNAELSQWEISFVWGLAVSMAIYVTGAVSRTHINPAVTITVAMLRGFPWKNVMPYIVAQLAGAFTGAGLVYWLYRGGFAQFAQAENMVRGSAESVETAGIFSTYPAAYLSNFDAFLVEVFITAILLIVILAVVDDKNPSLPDLRNLGPLVIGLTVAMIGGSFGTLTGFALNPARDFGPRLFAWVAGWDSIALPGPGGYFWVPILGPIIGGLLGGVIYDKLVRRYLQSKDEIPAGQAGEGQERNSAS
ncbi:MAG: aquaporin family protein [Firmicutes bacterium]|uniref:Glycerol uptake facilitator protein n=1 Tax=Melghirimyces thermohalophilus TaxID=1236220 RepID=A0A1G6HU07_9BACL|nr:MIP/aquaporin family protein [Melghirimyces thermohalophilus]MDA8351720.1 aquaporin family protein [Bacillota bacterium]SDB97722.1 glycerol uptake facilitator protein [Melghirimyces thermohalophilus]